VPASRYKPYRQRNALVQISDGTWNESRGLSKIFLGLAIQLGIDAHLLESWQNELNGGAFALHTRDLDPAILKRNKFFH